MSTRKIPPGLYGPDHNGLLDPDRFTAQERATQAPEALNEALKRRGSASPLVRALQAATDKALGWRGRR